MNKITNEICHGCSFYDHQNIKCLAVSCNKITGNYLKIHDIAKEIYREGYTDGYNKARSELEEIIKVLKELIIKFD